MTIADQAANRMKQKLSLLLVHMPHLVSEMKLKSALYIAFKATRETAVENVDLEAMGCLSDSHPDPSRGRLRAYKFGLNKFSYVVSHHHG